MQRTTQNLLRIAALAAVCTLPMFGAVTIVTSSLPAASVGAYYSIGFAVNGGVGPYTWSGTGNIPPGLSISPGGSINGTPTTAGTYSFTLSVSDSQGSSGSRTLSLTVASPSISITTTSLPSATQGQSYSFTLGASSGTPPYRWAVTGSLPAGLTLDAQRGVISGVPTAAGNFSFSLQVTDSAQATASVNVTLRVLATSISISTVPPIFTGTVGISYSQPFAATGGTAPYRWSILSGNTDGLTLDPATGALSGTPAATGTFDFTVQVSDAAGATASKSFSLTVNPPTLTIVTSAAIPAGAVGASYSQKLPVSAAGGTPPYRWSVQSGPLPPGLDLATDTLILSGTPTSPGQFSFTLQVTDAAGQTASRSLSITIAPGSLTLTTARALPDGTLNVAYRASVAATGGAPPYTWSAAGLPAGLTMDASTGTISGTPSAAGPFALAITVRDAGLNSLSDRFTLNIALPPPPPVSVSGLPATADPAGQYRITVALGSPFAAPITGQAILTFTPESGATDKTVQFASGGTTANFTIPAGSTAAQSDVPLALQTGTVAGTIAVSIRLQAGGIDITPSGATMTTTISRAAPVITGVKVSRSSGNLELDISGYSTAREVTQATFTFAAASGQTLQSAASSVVVAVDSLFSSWYQNSANATYGSQFMLKQPFAIQGDSNAVLPQSVTLTNRSGSTTYKVQ